MSTIIYPLFTPADQCWIDGKMIAALKAELAGDPKRAQWLRDMVDPNKPIEIKPRNTGKSPKKMLDNN